MNSSDNMLTIELGSHQVHRQDLIGSCQTTTVNLTILHCSRLHELLEHNAVVTVFASCNANTIRTQRLYANTMQYHHHSTENVNFLTTTTTTTATMTQHSLT